jgi:uncharacterized membrane protein YfcA
MIATLALALVSGLLIGCIGVGGVLLVPGLSLMGVDVHAAIGASMFSYLFSGVIGSWLYARKASIDWLQAMWLGAGAMPGALAGALLAARLSGSVLLGLVGAAVIFAGSRELLRRPVAGDKSRVLSVPALVMIGVTVGVGSALTGTGGAMMLVPWLMLLRVPVLAAVGLSQAVTIPVAGLASVGNLWAGQLDIGFGTLLGVGIAVGTVVGARLAHALPSLFLRRLVAGVLLLVGALLVVRAI